MAEYNPEMAPTYTGEQPGAIRKFLGELLGIDKGIDRYEDVFAEGVPSYDIASGDVRPIGRREIRYGDAQAGGTLDTPNELKTAVDEEFRNAAGTVTGGGDNVTMYGDGSDLSKLDYWNPEVQADALRQTAVGLDDASTAVPTNAAEVPVIKQTLDIPAPSLDTNKKVPTRGVNGAARVSDVNAMNEAMGTNLPSEEDVGYQVRETEDDFVSNELNLTGDEPPEAATLPNESAENLATAPGSRVIPGNWAGVPRKTARSNNPYYTGDDMGDLNDIDLNSLNPLAGMDITGNASLPPGVMNELNEILSTPVPSPSADQLALAQGGGGPSRFRPVGAFDEDLEQSGAPPKINLPSTVIEEPPVEASNINPPQEAPQRNRQTSISLPTPNRPTPKIPTTRTVDGVDLPIPNADQNQMLMDQNRENGGIAALLQSIMNMISRDPAAEPSGRGGGIPSIMNTLMNPASRIDPSIDFPRGDPRALRK